MGHAAETSAPRFGRAGLILRVIVVLALLGAYWLLFWPAHRVIGNPAFLLGLVPCVAAGAFMGARAALLIVVVTVLLDRSSAMLLPQSPETGISVLVIPVLIKLMLGVGVGVIADSRWRLRITNARLLHEIEVRKRSEESLERSERLHRALVDSLGEGVGLFDPSDRFLFAKQALCSMLQTAPAVLQGQQFSCFFVDASRDRIAEASRVVGAVKDAETVPRCYDVVLKADDSRLLLVTETLLTQVGTSDALTLRVLRDLTERITSERRQRDLEREVQRSQAFQSLAVLAGGVAHDFNNLLSGVVGNAEFAQLKVPESAPPQLSQSLAEIKAFATEAAQLSRQMLAYAGQRSLAIESLDVNAEIGEALRLLHATIDSRSRLVLDLSDQIPHVAADKYQLRQVVTNLVMNALEAMENQRGSLTLQTTCEKLTLERLEHLGRPPALASGEYVRISVTDTGSGIATDVRERIFDPFFSTKSPGRGMGLAAALGIVRSHRGWLDIESTTGVGTTFRVFWPAAQHSVETLPRSVRPAAGAIEKRCVLLIDDEPAVRIVTAKLLRELGQRVLVAESGRAGIELLSQHGDAVDLVLLDLTMPEQSGSEVLGELRRVRDDVKVVVTSGYHASDASMLLSTPNVIGFLEKPHTLARLEVILASLPPSSREHDK